MKTEWREYLAVFVFDLQGKIWLVLRLILGPDLVSQDLASQVHNKFLFFFFHEDLKI